MDRKTVNRIATGVCVIFLILNFGMMLHYRSNDVSSIVVHMVSESDSDVYYEIYFNGEFEKEGSIAPGEQGWGVLTYYWGLYDFGGKECTVVVKATVDEETFSESQTISIGRWSYDKIEFKF